MTQILSHDQRLLLEVLRSKSFSEIFNKNTKKLSKLMLAWIFSEINKRVILNNAMLVEKTNWMNSLVDTVIWATRVVSSNTLQNIFKKFFKT